MENPALVVAVGGLLLNLLVTVIGGVWKLSRMELTLRQAINEASKDTDERMDRQARHFGEAVIAARQQTTDLGFYVRDNFVRKDEMAPQLKALLDKLDGLQR